MCRMKQMAAILRKKELDIKYHSYYSQMESLTYIKKELTEIIFYVTFFEIWDMLRSIHCIMLDCDYNLA